MPRQSDMAAFYEKREIVLKALRDAVWNAGVFLTEQEMRTMLDQERIKVYRALSS